MCSRLLMISAIIIVVVVAAGANTAIRHDRVWIAKVMK